MSKPKIDWERGWENGELYYLEPNSDGKPDQAADANEYDWAAYRHDDRLQGEDFDAWTIADGAFGTEDDNQAAAIEALEYAGVDVSR